MRIVSSLLIFLFAAGCDQSPPVQDQEFQDRLKIAEPAALRAAIDERARALGVTAASFTLIDGNNPPKTYHFGRARDGAMFQVASISKTVAATCILTLAHNEGVSLDDDISARITSLDVGDLPGGQRPITLRGLLSHTAGAIGSGYDGYPRDTSLPDTAGIVRDPPGLFESGLSLDGQVGQFNYSGAGYMLAQLWAEDVSKTSFPSLCDRLVFSPLGLQNTTFEQPAAENSNIIGADVKADVMSGRFGSLEDDWHVYPEHAAAGLWSTSDDFALFVIALMDAANGKDTGIHPEVAKDMITPQVKLAENSHYGLGTQLVTNSNGSLRYMSHSGMNLGYRALFSARPATETQSRRVVVSLANTESGNALNHDIVYALTDP